MMLPPVDSQRAVSSGQTAPNGDAAALEDAGRQFEGLLLGMILKDALTVEPDEDSGSGMALMQEFTAEHMARAVAQDATLGMAGLISRRPSVSVEKQPHSGKEIQS